MQWRQKLVKYLYGKSRRGILVAAVGAGFARKSILSPSLITLIEILVVSGLPQFFASRSGGMANFVDGSLQYFSGNAKVLSPVFHL
jgi:hypothetical protein